MDGQCGAVEVDVGEDARLADWVCFGGFFFLLTLKSSGAGLTVDGGAWAGGAAAWFVVVEEGGGPVLGRGRVTTHQREISG